MAVATVVTSVTAIYVWNINYIHISGGAMARMQQQKLVGVCMIPWRSAAAVAVVHLIMMGRSKSRQV